MVVGKGGETVIGADVAAEATAADNEGGGGGGGEVILLVVGGCCCFPFVVINVEGVVCTVLVPKGG